jgi:hypothetical protein
MKKQFITEAARLQKLAGIITESQYRELNENVDDLRRIWEKTVEGDRNTLKENPPEDPKVSNNFEQAVADASYSTIRELAQSLTNTTRILEDEYEIDFGDVIEYIIRLCKEMNFKDTGKLVKDLIDTYHDDWSDEEKEEFEDDFIDRLYGDIIKDLFNMYDITNLEEFKDQMSYSDLIDNMSERLGGVSTDVEDMVRARRILEKYAADYL